MSEPPYEIAGDPRAGPLLFTCEHATRLLPPEWEPEPEDLPILSDHFGFDVGAADLTRALARRMGCGAVLSRFSRLVCDPNRKSDEPSFVVTEALGRALSFNRNVDAAERQRRDARYAEPYHRAIDAALAARRAGAPVSLCSIHSFTPIFEGGPREMEVGVLYDAHEAHARAVAEALAGEGFAVAHNEPYSGYAGLVYAVSRHGRAHGVPYLELEVRSDRIDTPARADAVALRIARALAVYAPGLK